MPRICGKCEVPLVVGEGLQCDWCEQREADALDDQMLKFWADQIDAREQSEYLENIDAEEEANRAAWHLSFNVAA